MSETKTCQHEPCDCQVGDDTDFCCQACEKADREGSTECPCPHDHCGAH